MKYLKKFNVVDDYIMESANIEYPTISLTKDNGQIWYCSKPMGFLRAVFKTEEDNQTALLYNLMHGGYSNIGDQKNGFKTDLPYKITVDDVEYIPTSDSASTYGYYHTFETAGEHEVKYYYNSDVKALNTLFTSMYLMQVNESAPVQIVEIDFSEYDTSNVQDMSYMLYGDSSGIRNVNFGGLFTTKNVKYFNYLTNRWNIQNYDINLEIIKYFDLSGAENTNGLFTYAKGYHYFEKETIDNMSINDGWYINANEVPFGYRNDSALNTVYAILEVGGKVVYTGYDLNPRTWVDFSGFSSNSTYRWIVKLDDSANTVVTKNNMYLPDNITRVVGNLAYGLGACECGDQGYYHTYDVYQKNAAQVFEFIGVGVNGCSLSDSVLEGYPHSCYYYKNIELNNDADLEGALTFSHNDIVFYNTPKVIAYDCIYTDRGEFGICADFSNVSIPTTSQSRGGASTYINSPANW